MISLWTYLAKNILLTNCVDSNEAIKDWAPKAKETNVNKFPNININVPIKAYIIIVTRI